MTRAPILFRVDAGPRPGYEHLSRCLVLAAALQRRRRPAYFLSRLDPGSLGLMVKRGGNEWLDEIVERLRFECLHGERIVRRDEHDDLHAIGAARLDERERVELRHLHIEKHEIRR